MVELIVTVLVFAVCISIGVLLYIMWNTVKESTELRKYNEKVGREIAEKVEFINSMLRKD